MAKRASLSGVGFIPEKNSNGDRLMERGPSPPVEAVEAVKTEDATMIIRPPPFSILPGGDIYEVQIAGAVTTELTSIVAGELPSGLVVAINSVSEGGNDDDLRINIDQPINVPNHESAMQLIARALWIVGLITLVMDVRTVFYKPAKGVVFGQNKLAYYVILAVIFAFGVGEVSSAFWISRFGHTRHGFWIWGFVLFLSIWPFIGILSIGGFA